LNRGRRPKSDTPSTDVSGDTRDTDYQASITNRPAVATRNGAFWNRSTTSMPRALRRRPDQLLRSGLRLWRLSSPRRRDARLHRGQPLGV